MSDIYEICHDCKYAIFHSEDPGFSPKECGLASRCITYLDGCKKDLDPAYNERKSVLIVRAMKCGGIGYDKRTGNQLFDK